MRIALAQINSTVGDLSGNTAKICSYIDKAKDLDVDLIAFPELAITGYPPEDLVFRNEFVQENMKCSSEVSHNTQGITAIFGFVELDNKLYNSAAVASEGKLKGTHKKIFLPNYGVFDEERYFESGNTCPVFTINGTKVGVNVCEDIWYPVGPTSVQRAAGAELIININGSPFHAGKRQDRESMLIERASAHGLFIAYVNQVGGQDELVFDGSSVVIDPEGKIISRGEPFEEDLVICDIDTAPLRQAREANTQEFFAEGLEDIGKPVHRYISDEIPQPKKPFLERAIHPVSSIEEVRKALVIGTRDYVNKSGFQKVLIALSGGIDSSLVAAIAAEALGPDNVIGVSMPSQFSSVGSETDAKDLAKNIGIRIESISIREIVASMELALRDQFHGTEWGVAEENIQSRIRGNLIMAMSNKFGWMVLTTGNKSEMAVGYATIYGDMAGGFSVIKDVPKLMVYDLCKHINGTSSSVVIPQSVMDKPPSAELRPDQKDTDSLPNYDILDPILEAYVERDSSFREIVADGFESETVANILTLVDRNEYKRRQSPPGVKITPRNFGRDRRMPVTNKFRSF
ncbi:MAG: NAD+ synthase [SAR202 cluster bacterium]|nr:NAD+ synthase [SAR202 cluster bacterium]